MSMHGLPRRERRRKASEERRQGDRPKKLRRHLVVTFNRDAGTFFFGICLPDGSFEGFVEIPPHYAASVASLIGAELKTLEGLRDAVPAGDGRPS